jgi:hypothetical protein
MTFELLFCPRGDDQISDLRRQKAPQPAHALDFAYLVRDTLFKLLVQLVEIIEQPRIFDGNDGLRGEVLE